MFAKRAWIRHSVPLVHEMRNDLREIGAPDKDDRMIRIEFDSIVEPIGRLVETGAGPTSPHHLRRVRGSLGCELLLASNGRALVGPAEGSGDRPRVAVFGSLTVGTGGVAAADGRSSTSCDRRRPTSFSRGPRGLYPTHRARVACRRDEVHWRQLPRSGDAGAAVIGCCSSLGPPLTHEGCPEESAPRARRDRSRAERRTTVTGPSKVQRGKVAPRTSPAVSSQFLTMGVCTHAPDMADLTRVARAEEAFYIAQGSVKVLWEGADGGGRGEVLVRQGEQIFLPPRTAIRSERPVNPPSTCMLRPTILRISSRFRAPMLPERCARRPRDGRRADSTPPMTSYTWGGSPGPGEAFDRRHWTSSGSQGGA